MKYTIITPGPLIVDDWATLDEAKAYVERYGLQGVKRGWTTEWEETEPGVWRYFARNSKGVAQRGWSIVLRKGGLLDHPHYKERWER